VPQISETRAVLHTLDEQLEGQLRCNNLL